MYADVESLLIGWLPSHLGGTRALTTLPANLATVLPIVQVTRISGGDSVISLDQAIVDFDTYAATRAGAQLLCEQVRGVLRLTLPGTVIGGFQVSRVATLSGPAWRPYENPAVQRFGASYQITVSSHG